ncbi:uncharacterized protein LOC123540804 [Mercenaria mercenaria]|uniref:uncharacterized protein LOC123540804 n=1 Tax=Mercenaria mercenaria TaxID=6596 RepID=UPI00234FAEA1|nr:uncharacterized protein LOC123540804 [Mercenaria mercenaria]
MLFLLWIAASSIQTLYAWKCLFCSDAVTPTDCSKIQRCGPYEECLTDKYLTAGGDTRYNLGCRDTKQCKRSQADFKDIGKTMVCSECCSGKVCNSAGCKYKGYPSPRGPICTNCPMQADVDGCDNITMCQQDEVCMLGFHGQFGFRTQCEKQTVCYRNLHDLWLNIEILGKRQLQNTFKWGNGCMKCCNTDMCNDNCNETSSSDYIAN